MNDERREQIRSLILDIIDNTTTPKDYSNHKDFKRDWLNGLVDVAQEEIRKL